MLKQYIHLFIILFISYMSFFVYFEIGLIIYPRLALNSWSPCLIPPSAGMLNMCHCDSDKNIIFMFCIYVKYEFVSLRTKKG